MASKSVYQDYNPEAIKHFDLEGETYNLPNGSTLVTDDVTTYNKIKEILQEPKVKKLSGFKKAFILPGCPITQDRLKSALKEHKITVTNDYELADVIITHNDFYSTLSNSEKIKSTLCMARLDNFSSYEDNGKRHIYQEDSCGYSSWNLPNEESLYDERFITGMAVNLAFLIESGEVSTISADSALHCSSNRTVLTLDIVKQIEDLYLSYNNDDREIANQLIVSVDYDTNPHLFWKLSQNIYSTMNVGRNKDLKYYIDASKMYKNYCMSAEQKILDLEQKGKLTTESFRFLEKICRQEIHIANRELYVFKVNVKKEYRKYLKLSK
jgi:hypothetical protein